MYTYYSPHNYSYSKLQDRFKELVQMCFIKRNRYKCLVLGQDKSYLKKNTLILPKTTLKLISSTCSRFCLTAYFVMLNWCLFQQTVGITMGTNCAPILADLFTYSSEADFIQRFHKTNRENIARSVNFTFRYRWCPFTRYFYVWWWHLSHWA